MQRGRSLFAGARPLSGDMGCPRRWLYTLFLERGLASNPLFVDQTGCAEGRSPFAGGTGVSPVFRFTTPFLARKGDGGMVETVVGRQRYQGSGAEVLRQSPREEGGSVGWLKGPSAPALRLRPMPFAPCDGIRKVV